MTANNLCYTVAKHSFPFLFDSDEDQEFNDADITKTDIANIDLSVALENAINFDLPEDDLCMINLSVAVVEATSFVITKEDLAYIDQSAQSVQVTNLPETEEDRNKMEMNVDLEFPGIDWWADKEEEPMDSSLEVLEQHNKIHKIRDHQNGEQHQH